MASTNKTSHYNLSQYIGTDKPTYLVDYNTDMSNIDTGIYNAQTTATSAAGSVGDITNLETTDKSNIVSAVNEVNTKTDDLLSLSTDVAANKGNIGTMANLNTSDKSSLVNAINEVDTNVDNLTTKFNINNIIHYTTGVLSNGTLISCDITVATNSDKSICKIYGQILTNDGSSATLTLPTSFNVDSDVRVNYVATKYTRNSFTVTGFGGLTINNNGSVSLDVGDGVAVTYFSPVIIFTKNFDDNSNV